MTAATFEHVTGVQAAPRALVEDAWVALNKRYAIGAAVLLAALALLWAIGLGPNAGRGTDDGAGTSMRTGVGPTAAPAAPAGAAAPVAPAAEPRSGTPASSSSAGPDSAAAPAAAAPASQTASPNGAARPATGSADAIASGSDAAAMPRTVPGTPVARLLFEPDQAWPSGEVGPRLAPVLARLKADPDTKALVSGFHDRRGSIERNAALAQRRAETVRRVLIREGIAADRVVLAKPQQTTGSGADREARRVEVTVAR